MRKSWVIENTNILICQLSSRSFKPRHLRLDPNKAARKFLNGDNNLQIDYAPNRRTTSFPRTVVNAGQGNDHLELDDIYGENFASAGKGDDIIEVNKNKGIKNLRKIPRLFGGEGSDDFIIEGGRVRISDYKAEEDRIDIGFYANRRRTRVIDGDLYISTRDGNGIKCIVDNVDLLGQITFVNDPFA